MNKNISMLIDSTKQCVESELGSGVNSVDSYEYQRVGFVLDEIDFSVCKALWEKEQRETNIDLMRSLVSRGIEDGIRYFVISNADNLLNKLECKQWVKKIEITLRQYAINNASTHKGFKLTYEHCSDVWDKYTRTH
ncbi:TPA: hypothetical protein ACPJ16_002370 [Vibrio alginolyticus]